MSIRPAVIFITSLNDLHSPFLMKDMRQGVARLLKAIHNTEKIMIYGDYDADGITSVVILYKFIREITPFIDYYIPDRIQEGYGLKNRRSTNSKKTTSA